MITNEVEELKEMGFQLDETGKPIIEPVKNDEPGPDGKAPDDSADGDKKDDAKTDTDNKPPDAPPDALPDDVKKDDAKPEPDDDTDEYNSVLDEYEINSPSDLKEALKATDEMAAQLEEANKKIKELETKKPEFKSKRQEKIYEFFSNYDIDSMGDGLTAYAKLVSLPLDTISNKDALREQYVLENMDVSREKAIMLFEEEYNDKYVIDQDDFDSEEAYKKKKELLEIKFEKAALKAKSFLKEESQKYKAEGGQPKQSDKSDDSKSAEAIEASRTGLKAEFSKAMKGFDSLIFEIEGKKDADFTFKLRPDQLKKINERVNAFLDQDNIYDKNGKLAYTFNPEDQKTNFAIALFGKEIIAEAIKHGITLGSITDVIEKSKEKPERKSSGVSATKLASMDEQFEQLAAKKAKERGEI